MQHRHLTGLLLAAVFACASLPARAAATLAGTQVVNTASASWQVNNIVQPSLSASASFKVAQLVQVSVSWQDAAEVITPAGAAGTLVFRLTNSGNGTDSFSLTTTLPTTPAPAFAPASCKLYLDTDGNGLLNVSADAAYASGVNDPSLAAGASMDVFVSCRAPTNAAGGSKAQVSLDVASVTLTGANQDKCLDSGCAGTTDPVLGLWAVTDASAGQAEDTGHYAVISPSFDFPLAQSVRDPDGGTSVVPGSIVTYTMEVTPTGTSPAYESLVTDPIPEHTTYLPGSITLDGQALTDADDSDAGRFNASTTPKQIEVTLGQINPTPATTHIITFQVTINSD